MQLKCKVVGYELAILSIEKRMGYCGHSTLTTVAVLVES